MHSLTTLFVFEVDEEAAVVVTKVGAPLTLLMSHALTSSGVLLLSLRRAGEILVL